MAAIATMEAVALHARVHGLEGSAPGTRRPLSRRRHRARGARCRIRGPVPSTRAAAADATLAVRAAATDPEEKEFKDLGGEH